MSRVYEAPEQRRDSTARALRDWVVARKINLGVVVPRTEVFVPCSTTKNSPETSAAAIPKSPKDAGAEGGRVVQITLNPNFVPGRRRVASSARYRSIAAR